MAHFSDYALWKMSMRGIERDEVELVLADPEWDEASQQSERHVYGRSVGGRNLLVIVEPYDHTFVVNAYRPTPREPWT